MLRLLADENFNGRILRALRRRIPDLDVVRMQDTPLSATDDPTLLQFDQPIGRVIEDLELVLLASQPEELEAQVRFLPL